jgi:hypothetical protein
LREEIRYLNSANQRLNEESLAYLERKEREAEEERVRLGAMINELITDKAILE